MKRRVFYIFFGLIYPLILFAQPIKWKGDSWADVFKNKSGTVTALWYDIEPFIYTDGSGNLIGVEYEVMESLKKYLKDKYAINLKINWVNAGSFENIYAQVKNSVVPGIFGWSYYSITPAREKEIKFTPAYMPDLNVLVTNSNSPIFNTAQEFIEKIDDMKAYTMESTTMEDDIMSLQKNFSTSLQVLKKNDDYEIMQSVSKDDKAFGYVPLSIYIVGLQRGIEVKRQNILISRREGFAGIMPFNTDWTPITNEYFTTNEFKILSGKIVSKYLGSELTDLVFGISASDSLAGIKNELELVKREKEIVTKRFINAAIDKQKEKIFKISLILGAIIVLILAIILYGRYVSKQRFYKLLQQRNDIIVNQKEEIEIMNKRLEMKVLLAQMNPHLIFNSLNAIQYFVTLDEKKSAIKYINNFSKHLRLILNNASSLTITIEDEIKMLRQYLQLEQIRFENKFDFTINIDEKLNKSFEIPSMLIYPYIEAALYQGILQKRKGRGEIKINFDMSHGFLLLTIFNNGEGKEAASSFLAKREGMEFNNGINTVLQHIELLNYAKETKVSVQQIDVNIEGDIIGTKVILTIPLKWFNLI